MLNTDIRTGPAQATVEQTRLEAAKAAVDDIRSEAAQAAVEQTRPGAAQPSEPSPHGSKVAWYLRLLFLNFSTLKILTFQHISPPQYTAWTVFHVLLN